MPLSLEIVTPEGRALEKQADSVTLPTAVGEIGILPGHLPLTTRLEPGELRVLSKAGDEAFVVSRGFAMIANDTISVLTDSAINETLIDESAAEEAMARAEKALAERAELHPDEVARLESVVRFAVAQLTVRKRR